MQLKLTMVFGQDAYGLSTVHEWMRTDVQDILQTGRALIEELNDRILTTLEDDWWHSYEAPGELLDIGASAANRHLAGYMAMRPMACKWAPHGYTDCLRERRVAI
jgi:hypothetical protein